MVDTNASGRPLSPRDRYPVRSFASARAGEQHRPELIANFCPTRALKQTEDSHRRADVRCMAQIVCLLVSAPDRARLEAIVAGRNRAQKHVAPARIILHRSAERRRGRQARRGRPAGGVALAAAFRRGRDRGPPARRRCKPGRPRLDDGLVRRVVALTRAEPPGAATHWTGRAMDRHTGICLRSVQRIWAAHDLQPHCIRTFKRSSDPDFAAKLKAIVGLYFDPSAHSLVLSLDERSQIQVLDRTHAPVNVRWPARE